MELTFTMPVNPTMNAFGNFLKAALLCVPREYRSSAIATTDEKDGLLIVTVRYGDTT